MAGSGGRGVIVGASCVWAQWNVPSQPWRGSVFQFACPPLNLGRPLGQILPVQRLPQLAKRTYSTLHTSSRNFEELFSDSLLEVILPITEAEMM